MTRSKLVKSILIVCVIIATLCVGIVTLNSKDDTAQSFTPIYQLGNFDKSLISQSEIRKLLKKTYYSGKDVSGFSSIPLYSAPNLYNMYWVLSLNKKLGNDIRDFKDLKELQKISGEFPLSNPNYIELDNLRMITGVYNYLGSPGNNETQIKKIISEHFDNESNLYFWKNKDESMEDKISATNVVLSILNNMNSLSTVKEVSSVKGQLIKLFNNDNYFTNDDINNTIINNGGPIIISLMLLGVTPDEDSIKAVYKKRIDWINYWNSFERKNDFYSLMVLNQLIKINTFFKLQLSVENSYVTSYFGDNGSFEGMGYESINSTEKESLNIEPQYVDMLLNICQSTHFEFPFKKELLQYVNDSIEVSFVKNGDVDITMDDNYYGLKIANSFGFPHDKAKVLQLLNSWVIKNVEEDSNIHDSYKLQQILYVLLSYKELEESFPSTATIENSVVDYLNRLEYKTYPELVETISEYKTGLEILRLLDSKIPKTTKQKIKSILSDEKDNKQLFDNIIVTDISEIIGLLNDNNLSKLLNQKITSSLGNLRFKGGYKQRVGPLGEPDVYSTAKALKSKKVEISEKDKIEINSFVLTLKSDHNEFKLSQTGSTGDLKAIFELLQISSYY
ncbi:hypothetical protein ACFPVX_24490 [Cohnella faecalis]|uniref:Uncharacterized protein n=1 Tax=Cohnella faecalis TaxID=2315694 RepID=A0A398CS76_9BACL|nr:hypothetical protein [Cohnella faecalis]RIE05060.1 hypothetical protein D3H35_02715 [Cohnella faecalis]